MQWSVSNVNANKFSPVFVLASKLSPRDLLEYITLLSTLSTLHYTTLHIHYRGLSYYPSPLPFSFQVEMKWNHEHKTNLPSSIILHSGPTIVMYSPREERCLEPRDRPLNRTSDGEFPKKRKEKKKKAGKLIPSQNPKRTRRVGKKNEISFVMMLRYYIFPINIPRDLLY